MEKILKVLGGIFLALIVVLAIGAMVLVPKWSSLDKEVTEYIEANLPKIVESWNPSELQRRADPELLAMTSANDLEQMFAWMSTLGRLQKLDKPIGEIGWGQYKGSPMSGTWADYNVKAVFDSGPAEIKIVLRRSGDTWRIVGFHINSAALVPVTVKQPWRGSI